MKTVSTTVKLGLSACLVAAAFVATPSNAAIVVPCNSTNITVSGAAPTSFDCAGFVDGNALNASDKNTDPTTSELLAELDYFGSLTGIETFTGLDGLRPITFESLLSGETIIGIHYGNGSNLFTTKTPGGATAFYKFDAGTIAGLQQIGLAFTASSAATLYKTGMGPVPEPSTWILMLLGMAGVGFTMRRKDKQTLRVRYA